MNLDMDRDVGPDNAESSEARAKGQQNLFDVDMEMAFLRCLPYARPIGKHRHFRMIALQSKIMNMTGVVLECEAIWKKLGELYDLEDLDEMASSSASFPSSPRSLSPLPRVRKTPPSQLDLHDSSSESGAEPTPSKRLQLEILSVKEEEKEDRIRGSSSESLSPAPELPPPVMLPDPVAVKAKRGRKPKRKSDGTDSNATDSTRITSTRNPLDAARSRGRSRSTASEAVSITTSGQGGYHRLGKDRKKDVLNHQINKGPAEEWSYPALPPYPIPPDTYARYNGNESPVPMDGRPKIRQARSSFTPSNAIRISNPNQDEDHIGHLPAERYYETNKINPPAYLHLPSGSRSADLINSRFFKREFTLPIFSEHQVVSDWADKTATEGTQAEREDSVREGEQGWHEMMSERGYRKKTAKPPLPIDDIQDAGVIEESTGPSSPKSTDVDMEERRDDTAPVGGGLVPPADPIPDADEASQSGPPDLAENSQSPADTETLEQNHVEQDLLAIDVTEPTVQLHNVPALCIRDLGVEGSAESVPPMSDIQEGDVEGDVDDQTYEDRESSPTTTKLTEVNHINAEIETPQPSQPSPEAATIGQVGDVYPPDYHPNSVDVGDQQAPTERSALDVFADAAVARQQEEEIENQEQAELVHSPVRRAPLTTGPHFPGMSGQNISMDSPHPSDETVNGRVTEDRAPSTATIDPSLDLEFSQAEPPDFTVPANIQRFDERANSLYTIRETHRPDGSQGPPILGNDGYQLDGVDRDMRSRNDLRIINHSPVFRSPTPPRMSMGPIDISSTPDPTFLDGVPFKTPSLTNEDQKLSERSDDGPSTPKSSPTLTTQLRKPSLLPSDQHNTEPQTSSPISPSKPVRSGRPTAKSSSRRGRTQGQARAGGKRSVTSSVSATRVSRPSPEAVLDFAREASPALVKRSPSIRSSSPIKYPSPTKEHLPARNASTEVPVETGTTKRKLSMTAAVGPNKRATKKSRPTRPPTPKTASSSSKTDIQSMGLPVATVPRIYMDNMDDDHSVIGSDEDELALRPRRRRGPEQKSSPVYDEEAIRKLNESSIGRPKEVRSTPYKAASKALDGPARSTRSGDTLRKTRSKR